MESNNKMVWAAVTEVYKQIITCMRTGIAKCSWSGVGYTNDQIAQACINLKPFFPMVEFTPSDNRIDAKWWWEIKQ